MIVLSHFAQWAPDSLINHRTYAAALAYRHIYIDASQARTTAQLYCLHKYSSLLHIMRSAEEGEAVLMLSEDAAVVDPLPLDVALDSRDYLLVRTSDHELPQTDVQIWRNSAPTRAIILDILRRCRLGSDPLTSEASLLGGLDNLHYWTLASGYCLVMQTNGNTDPAWARRSTFTISIDDNPEKPHSKGVTPRYREVLIEHINQRRQAGLPLFSFPDYAVVQTEERSTYQAGQALALVMLYTPNIGSYGRIAEHNLRQYCEKHGYTLYVHREIPSELRLDASGNWLKPWLLHAYMKHHEWVFWIDADVLIADLQRPLDSLLKERTHVLAHDIGLWKFNSGVMGFKKIIENEETLHRLMVEISALPDRSGVYINNGDQYFFIKALENASMLTDENVLDLFTVNTPWTFRRDDSFIVHYLGMWPEMRALMMAHDQQLTRH